MGPRRSPTRGDGSPPPTLKAPSWSSIANDRVVISEFHPAVDQYEGTASVTVPAEITNKPCPLWKNYIQGHFLGPAPHIGTVHAIVNKIWSSMGKNLKIDVQFLNSTTVLFKIDDDFVRTKVLKRCYWHIAEVPIVVYEWNPENAHRKLDLKSIPLWVDFSTVPGQLFSAKGLSYLASVVGKPIKLHPNTERCHRLDVARMLIEVDLTAPLTHKINVKTHEGLDFCIPVSYPWLPPKCSHCDAWGHVEKTCKASKVDVVTPSETAPLSKDEGSDLTSLTLISEPPSSEVVVTLPTDTQPPTMAPVLEQPAQIINETTSPLSTAPETSEWTIVKRSSRMQSPPSLPLQNPTNGLTEKKASPSPSRFTALSSVKEDGEIEDDDEEVTDIATIVSDVYLEHHHKHHSKNRSSKQVKKPIVSKKDIAMASNAQPSKRASVRKH